GGSCEITCRSCSWSTRSCSNQSATPSAPARSSSRRKRSDSIASASPQPTSARKVARTRRDSAGSTASGPTWRTSSHDRMTPSSGVSPISGGELAVLGQDPRRDGPSIRARFGVVPHQDTLDTELTVRDNLVLYGRYFGLSRPESRRRAEALLEFTQLAERADDTVE